MSIDHKLEITLSADDIAKIIADHLNKGLSNDFEVYADRVVFDQISTDSNATFTGATVAADFIDPKSRRIS